MNAAIWLVYSREHNGWWRPEASGYTNDIATAGRYTKVAAEAHCNARDRQRDGSPSEVACMAPEADEIMADLLEALEHALEVMEFAYMNASKQPKEISMARAAIAKAEPSTGEGG